MTISQKTALPSISQVGKSTLARLLALENITIIHDTVPTASFDLKNRVLRLPTWAGASRELYDMLVGHEVSHALHTPMEAWKAGIDRIQAATGKTGEFCKTYMNIVEDARIERLIKIKFPGLRRDFFIAYDALSEMKIFGDISKPETMCLGDRLNLHFKLGLHRGIVIPFSSDEKHWLAKMDNTTTFEEVIVLTIAIIKSLKESAIPQSQKESITFDTTSSDDATPSESESGESGESEASEGKGEAGEEEEEEEEEKEGKAAGKKSDRGTVSHDTSDRLQDLSPQSEPQTNEAMEKNIADKFSDTKESSAPHIIRCRVPDSHNVVVPWTTILRDVRADLANVHSDVKNYLNPIRCDVIRNASRTMAAAFNRRKSADVFKRSSIARTGNLDTLRMNQYRWCDDVFRRTVKVAEGKNHGICILVDWSASMSCMLQATVGQLLILTDFCRLSNIPFEVYAFTDNVYVSPATDNGSTPAKREELRAANHKKYEKDTTSIHPISLLNFLSSTMNKTDYEYAKSFLYYIRTVMSSLTHGYNFSLSGTPTCAAMYEMSQVVMDFRAKSNVQVCHTVILTDGDAGDSADLNHSFLSSVDPSNNRFGCSAVMDDPMTGESYDIRKTRRNGYTGGERNEWTFGSRKAPKDIRSEQVWIAGDILRRRTGSKIHMICLGDGSMYGGAHSRTSLAVTMWRRDGFYIDTAPGYDSFVQVNSRRFMKPHSSNFFSCTSGMTKSQLQKEFIAKHSAENCSKMIAAIIGAQVGTS